MSRITICAADKPNQILEQTTDGARIAEILNGCGVRFERWQATHVLAYDASQEDILDAYADSVNRLKTECGFQTVDVIHMKANHPQKKAFREKFLDEHTHTEDEVRFFVEGEGMFYLHIEDKVYMVLCQKGDLISVPANTTHWFDMGTQPEFTAIRFFNNPEGWVANYTGSTIAGDFPKMPFSNKAILLDIEGTTGSIEFVKEILFPYARNKMAEFIADNRNDAEVADILDRVAAEAGVDASDDTALVNTLHAWIDQDRKVTELKELQGLIWEDGYKSGAYTAHVYVDARDCMNAWSQAGRYLFVYSSGSVKAQQMFYEHSDFGDIRSLFQGYFDTNTGPKKEAASYTAIASEMGYDPGEVLFLSDVTAELDAARDAGMSTGLLVRDGDKPEKFDHDCFYDFGEIEVL